MSPSLIKMIREIEIEHAFHEYVTHENTHLDIFAEIEKECPFDKKEN